MRLYVLAPALLLFGACWAQETRPNTLTAEEKAAGWELLFDGRTMTGWQDPSRRTPPGDSWTIEDGCLKAVAHPRIREDLITMATFRDFEMVFDWRIAPGSNTGVKYLIQKTVFLDYDKVKPGMGFEAALAWEMEHHLSDRARLGPNSRNEDYVISFEYQLVDNERHPDARRGAQYTTGALYSMIPPSQAAARPVGEFNHSRLVVRGDHVEHWLNGVKVVDGSLDSPAVIDGITKRWKSVPAVYELLTKRPRRDCPIGLQNHGDVAWFQNVKIRRLGGSERILGTRLHPIESDGFRESSPERPRILSEHRLGLWYRQPARQWVDALPVGNGRLGAMVFGGVTQERIQFNEQTVWNGGPHEYQHPGAYKSLGAIRALLFEGKQAEAEKLAGQEFMSVPLRQKDYQAFGDLMLEFPSGEVADYRRDLDLDSAITSVRYSQRGIAYRREVFASWPAQAIVVRLTATKPGSLTFSASLKSAHKQATVAALSKDELSMSGQVADSAIRFEARLLAMAQAGRQEARGGNIAITGADSATLILTGATNFKNYRDVSGDPKERNNSAIAAVRGKSFDWLREAHVADHQRLFRRVSLELGESPSSELPTDERIAAFATGHDPQLVALLFQYGRYLMIASSRQGGQPANLQGLWNESNNPPWGSKYTCNINTEMNYWPAEATNLAECHRPLFNAMKELAESGAKTAKEQYNARGWVLHHDFDLWRGTAPINASNHGIWQTGGAWLCLHLWDHYLFGGDKEFLRTTAYPLMRGSALFFVDSLVKDPQRGWLISGPSNSPEQGGLVMGPTMDHQIIRNLFGAVIAASQILNTDAELRATLLDMRKRIAPNQIGKYGQLQEWLEDKDDPNNRHRHVSHLWGLYPGAEITPWGTPELFAAAKKSLEFRGDEATGWSMGWKVNLWARLLDGDHAYRILQKLIRPASRPGERDQSGVYANLFDAHPPFQIDGNFGVTAGIAEMLLQSEDPRATPTSLTDVQSGKAAIVQLLPALPEAFPDGRVSGLRARGGFEVDIVWRSGKLEQAVIRARESKPLTVRYAGKEVRVDAQAGGEYRWGEELK